MFREMRRINQQLSPEECARVLAQQPRGVLSVLGDHGYPYGVPMDHWYCEADGAVYFHCAKTGHKIDAVSAYDKASYCVMDRGYRKAGEWALNIRSVIVFGRICVVEDDAKKREICTHLVKKFTDDEDYLRQELENAFSRVQCLALKTEHITGKLVKES